MAVPRRGGTGALLLVAVAVVLGATVFRADIAQATGLTPSATADKTATKVLEQNLDGGNIRVHEEGTATVQQAGTPWTKALSSSNNNGVSFTAPADKRIVIQYGNGFITLGTGFSPVGQLNLSSSAGNSLEYDFVGTFLPNSIQRYEISQQVTIYVDPGATVKWTYPGNGMGFLQLSGYTLPA